MTLSITFYNNVRYTKDDFMNRDRDFFGNGLVRETDFEIQFPPSTTDLTFSIGTGVAWVDGYRIANDSSPMPLSVEPGSDLPRIDIVQIGHDDSIYKGVLVVKKGVPGSEPIEPGADANYYKLYGINVPAGATSFSACKVQDRRGLVPLHVSGKQISYEGVAKVEGDNVLLGTQTAPSFIATSQSAPLALPVLTAPPEVVGAAGTLCVVAGTWYISDGQSWSAMSDAPATADNLGNVKVGPTLTVEEDGTIGATPATIGAVSLQGDHMTGPLSAPSFTAEATDGTAPLSVTSKTKVANLNADLLDGLHADELVGQRIQATNAEQNQYHPIATLNSSSDGSCDKLVIEMIGGPSTGNDDLYYDRVLMSNRERFDYQYLQTGTDGGNARSNFRLLAYQQADDSVHVYMRASKQVTADVIVRVLGVGLDNSTTVLQIGVPTTEQPSTGIIVFDSALTGGNVGISAGTLRSNSLTAPLNLPNFVSLPTQIPSNGSICVVNGNWYISDGNAWKQMTGVTATETTLGSVKVGSSLTLADDGTIGATPASVGAVDRTGDSMTGNLTAPTFTANVAEGTAPLAVTSTTKVNNFNADLLDGVHADGLVGQPFQINYPATDQYFFVATLPANASGTYDKLVLELFGGQATSTNSLTYDRILLSNHNGFAYQYLQMGIDIGDARTNFRVVAYTQADNSVNVYLRVLQGAVTASIVRAYGIGVGNATTAITISQIPVTQTGSNVVFDSVNTQPNVGMAAGALTLSSQTAPLNLPYLTAVPGTVGSLGALCIVNGKWYVSDGTTWNQMTGAQATATSLGSVKVGPTLTLAGDGTIGATPASVGAVNLAGDTMTGNLTAPTFTSNVAQGTAPLAVTSTTKVSNLNADQVDGYHAGNAAGQVALNNGTLNVSLNADQVDGYHAGNAANQVAVNNGTLNVSLNADKVDGLHADALMGQAFQINSPATDQYYFVATLPANAAGTYDKLVLEVLGGQATSTNTLTYDRIMMSNHNGFAYQYLQMGIDTGNARNNFRVVAYTQADNSVNVYLRALQGTTSASIVRAYGIGVGNSTTAIPISQTPVTKTGTTTVFDSVNTQPNVGMSGGSLVLNSTQTAPLRLPYLTAIPSTVGASGSLCIVNGKWYVSDGTTWSVMNPPLQTATATTLGAVKIGEGINVAADGTIDIKSTVLEPFRMDQLNFINLALEVETLKRASLNGVTANIFVESFVDLNDITLMHGSYDSINQKLYLA